MINTSCAALKVFSLIRAKGLQIQHGQSVAKNCCPTRNEVRPSAKLFLRQDQYLESFQKKRRKTHFKPHLPQLRPILTRQTPLSEAGKADIRSAARLQARGNPLRGQKENSRMPRTIRSFIQEDAGTVSVDWIVLAFSVICLGCLTVATARDATFGLADSIATSVEEKNVLTISADNVNQ